MDNRIGPTEDIDYNVFDWTVRQNVIIGHATSGGPGLKGEQTSD
jgi:hypothetical protein